jgi:hypothetical protein
MHRRRSHSLIATLSSLSIVLVVVVVTAVGVHTAKADAPTSRALPAARPVQARQADMWDPKDRSAPSANNDACGDALDFGTGVTDLVVTGTSYTDDVRSPLAASAAAGQRDVVVASAAGMSPGDEVLLVQMQGAGAGNSASARIVSISGNTLTIDRDLAASFSQGGGDRTQVIRLPQYRNVEVQGVLTAHAWDGSTGGVVALRATGYFTVAVTGSVSATGIGYRHGSGGRSDGDKYHCATRHHGEQGEGEISLASPRPSSTTRNGVGGGGGERDEENCPEDEVFSPGGGGGGGHRTTGHDGHGGTQPNHHTIGGTGGATHGVGEALTLGGGGGGGGAGDDLNEHGFAGGDGGGVVFLTARHLVVSGQVAANGTPGGGDQLDPKDRGGGGGGAGGTIILSGESLDVGTGVVAAIGAAGGSVPAAPGNGGAGGTGGIVLRYRDSIDGSTNPPSTQVLLPCIGPTPMDVSITDPFGCTNNGDALAVQVVVNNSGGVALIGTTAQATLPVGLTGLAGTCTFVGGAGTPTCTVTPGGMTWTGDLPAASTLTINYQVQVSAGVPVGVPLCINTEFDNGVGGTTSVTACTIVNCAPTSVDLRYFRAVGAGDRVTLIWETATEANALGFNVYRSTEAGDPGIRLNPALIPATGGAAVGVLYQLGDMLSAEGTYSYRLEVVNRDGPPDVFGPMTVRWEGPRLYLPAVARSADLAAGAVREWLHRLGRGVTSGD